MAKLTESEWGRTFEIRCRSKRGESISDSDTRLVRAAFAEDRARYVSMNQRIFDETKPAGATR